MVDTGVSRASTGAVDAATCGCRMPGMCEHMKVDNGCGGQMSGCRSCIEWVTDAGEGVLRHREEVSGCGNVWGGVSTVVSSAKCNRRNTVQCDSLI